MAVDDETNLKKEFPFSKILDSSVREPEKTREGELTISAAEKNDEEILTLFLSKEKSILVLMSALEVGNVVTLKREDDSQPENEI